MFMRRLPLILCLMMFVAGTILLFCKYKYLGFYDWDLAFFSQASWAMLHGSQYTSVVGINYFGDHAYLISLLTLPFYWLWSSPLMLLMIKCLAFASSGYILFFIAERELNRPLAYWITAFYFFYPANLFSLIYEYNTENLAAPFLMGMIWAFQGKRWRVFFILSLFLLLIKENMVLLVVMFSLWGLLDRRSSSIGMWVVLLLISVVYFSFVTFIAIPYFRGLETHAFVVRYAHWGKNVPEIFINIVMHPQDVWTSIYKCANQGYFFGLFGPLLPVFMLGFPYYLMTLPILLQHCLSSSRMEHTIYFHYASSLIPLVFAASVIGIKIIKQRCSHQIFKISCIFLSIFLIWHMFIYKDRFLGRLNLGTSDRLKQWELVRLIPKGEPVIASFAFLAPLSDRQELYAFHKIYHRSYQNPVWIKRSELNVGKAFELPPSVKYALIDFKDSWLLQELGYDQKTTQDRVDKFMTLGWHEIARRGDVVLLLR